MNKKCTVYRTAGFIGKKWTILIMLELYKGKPEWKRYTRLKNSLVNITPKILSTRLKELKKEGIIMKRVDAKTFPVKSEYVLTHSGKDFIRIIKDMKKWALEWNIKNKSCSEKDCKACEL